MFSTLSKTKIIILDDFVLLSENALNLDESRILSSGKELIDYMAKGQLLPCYGPYNNE